MKTYATTMIAFTIAFLSYIQPCPAPPLAIGIVGGTVLGAGAAIGGAAAGSHGHGRKRDNDDFSRCVSQGIGSQQQIDFLANSSIVVSGLPGTCMSVIKNYNQHPQLADLNAIHGSTTVLNGTAVILENMPDYVRKSIETAQASAAGQALPQRRALGFESAFGEFASYSNAPPSAQD